MPRDKINNKCNNITCSDIHIQLEGWSLLDNLAAENQSAQRLVEPEQLGLPVVPERRGNEQNAVTAGSKPGHPFRETTWTKGL